MHPSRPVLPFVAWSLAVLPSVAQESAPPFRLPEVRNRPVERIVHAVHDVQSDTTRVVRVSDPGELALGTTHCFDNSSLSFGYVVANPGEDLLNWGVKSCGLSGLLGAITIAYQSEQNPPSGGPGATFSIALYTGTTGFGQPGAEVFRRTFTGMPTGFVMLRIDFGTEPLALADGAFGWSYLQLDGNTGPVLVSAPIPALGTVDAMDIYSPGPARAPAYVGTFNYGGCQTAVNPCANTWIQLEEIRPRDTARTLVLNGSGVNPVILDEVLPPRIGHVWAVRVDVVAPPFPNPAFTVLYASAAPLATPRASPWGEVLVDFDQLTLAPNLAEGSYSYAIPADTALVGRRLFFQAAVLRPATARVFLTNALDVRVGY